MPLDRHQRGRIEQGGDFWIGQRLSRQLEARITHRMQ